MVGTINVLVGTMNVRPRKEKATRLSNGVFCVLWVWRVSWAFRLFVCFFFVRFWSGYGPAHYQNVFIQVGFVVLSFVLLSLEVE